MRELLALVALGELRLAASPCGLQFPLTTYYILVHDRLRGDDMSEKQTQDHMVTFRMTAAELARLDRLANRFGVSRSQYLRNIVLLDIEETETFEKFGMIRAAITVRDVLDWMDAKKKKVSEELEGTGEVRA